MKDARITRTRISLESFFGLGLGRALVLGLVLELLPDASLTFHGL